MGNRSKIKLESFTGSSVNPFRYIGQFGYYDDTSRGSNSGLHLLGVRYYSPSRGTFISWDPISSVNRYNYVNSNPSGAIDPTGRILENAGNMGGQMLTIGNHLTFISDPTTQGTKRYFPMPQYYYRKVDCRGSVNGVGDENVSFRECADFGFGGNWPEGMPDFITGRTFDFSYFDIDKCYACCSYLYLPNCPVENDRCHDHCDVWSRRVVGFEIYGAFRAGGRGLIPRRN